MRPPDGRPCVPESLGRAAILSPDDTSNCSTAGTQSSNATTIWPRNLCRRVSGLCVLLLAQRRVRCWYEMPNIDVVEWELTADSNVLRQASPDRWLPSQLSSLVSPAITSRFMMLPPPQHLASVRQFHPNPKFSASSRYTNSSLSPRCPHDRLQLPNHGATTLRLLSSKPPSPSTPERPPPPRRRL